EQVGRPAAACSVLREVEGEAGEPLGAQPVDPARADEPVLAVAAVGVRQDDDAARRGGIWRGDVAAGAAGARGGLEDQLTVAEVRASLGGQADCPLLDAPAQEAFRQAVRAASAFSLQVGEFLAGRSPAEQAAWVRRSLAASQPLLQPWAMEVLYAVASAGTARF